MQYDYKVMEERFKQLPEDIQLALTSVSIGDTMKDIALKNGLHVDQESTLFDLTTYSLLGLISSKDFVKTFSREAGVTEEVSAKVAQEINSEIFGKIRSTMETAEEKKARQSSNDISAIERAGGFSIEKDNNERDSEHNNNLAQDHGRPDREQIDRGQTVTAIENEEGLAQSSNQESKKIYNSITPPRVHKTDAGESEGQPSAPILPASEAGSKTEPLIDQLLSGPVAQPEQKIVQDKTLKRPAAPQETKKSDLYREEV